MRPIRGIVGLDIFALAHDPVMVKVENERHIVRKGQKVVEAEADLVVLDRDQVSGRLRTDARARYGCPPLRRPSRRHEC